MAHNLSDWFCLKAGRRNFKPNVRKDRELIFCHTDEIEKQVQLSIERSFAIGHPVKMIIYGNKKQMTQIAILLGLIFAMLEIAPPLVMVL